MNCETILSSLGFECRPEPMVQAQGEAYAVETPLVFRDGECIGFYIIPSGDGSFRVTDNGDILAHMYNSGLTLEDRKSWQRLKKAAANEGLELLASGLILGEFPPGRLEDGVGAFMKFASIAAEWEEERYGIHDGVNRFVAEVEAGLRIWKPNEPIIHGPEVEGSSGKMQPFALKFGDRFVDAIRPDGRAVGGELRKIMDVVDALEDSRVMVVLDDREDPVKARSEESIISRAADVMLYSVLAQKGGRPPEFVH
ncbi:protein of unknown function DUF1828 [Thiohalospira halophila DSM 15071]|uniref:DUF1828 domain-containing protein n=1 Tax=Thiohalospira halophila DSM 15071 TaxID=1123397 RepID=A0A1I1P080_9GAMM|nr:DUF1828 domain-containing protein [Thiohalospira halophila]SFD03374.1 protein of unknown function DUF1828 [Thiohalospira halophila DSM 15071]